MTGIADALTKVVGTANVFIGGDIEDRYKTELSGRVFTEPAFVVRPRTVEEVAAILKAANETGTPVTTQGGRTGTVMGALPDAGAIVLSLERMNAIEELDRDSMTITVQAGATLQSVHEAAEAAGLLLPLDLGSRGTATVGGVISTNAGGLRAIRWGLARDMVIGVEAVLADGRIVNGLKKTLKDNAGYDWKHLMIGSEGTLGVVTRATLRLRPLPRSTMTALVALNDFSQVPAILRDMDSDLGGQLTSLEVMWGDYYQLITEANRAKRAPPMPATYPLYMLIEAMGGDPEGDPARFEAALGNAIERGQAADAVIAQSGQQRDELWSVREDLSDGLRTLRPSFPFDVSVGLGDMAETVEKAKANVRAIYPDAKVISYGHAGDGNMHFIVSVGDGSKETEHKVDVAIYSAVQEANGSVSAEHGVGLSKRDYLAFTRKPGEIDLMRTLKTALDPKNILNPGKILAPEA